MPRNTRLNPRKTAGQERSRATVDALIEATARILVREGFDRASTNHVADVAGVSVGSLYQYFPSKEALVAAVVDRHTQKIQRTVQAELIGIEAESLERGVRKLIAAAIEGHRVDPKLHAVVAEQIPRVGKLQKISDSSRANITRFREFLDSHQKEIRTLDLDLAAFVCVSSIEALTHNAVLHHAETFSTEAMHGLADEATRLIVGYLKK